MQPPPPSESARAFFAFHLKRHREGKGWSQPTLGAKIHISGSLVSGIELCNRRPTLKLCQTLDEVFDLDQFFEALYPRVIEETGLPAGFPEFIEVEAGSGVIKLYENFVITGILQTEDYARAVLRAGQHPEKLERLVAARLERQEILRRENPPVLVALLDESVLRRSFGGPGVMRAQLENLLDLAELPHVHIHVVPGDAELCPEGAFMILSSTGEPDTAYAESAGGRGRLIDDDGYVAELGILLELIRSKALNAEDSQTAIRKALEEL
ncbi:XRE family transcriptional regulator [Actinomadura darangshiensis]|uniref:XRE family transcriptional regulator n=1 Tax=Actinomadura darangshiensis TaxID=705336 RepID=A0A4R5BTC2_9ACTN|nr:helix-turn-helix transcriptional regulator [Actinomadura darangshiensis]TDD89325.1 XRE family transcriptional regulator [Actinomadura darangshiensis]